LDFEWDFECIKLPIGWASENQVEAEAEGVIVESNANGIIGSSSTPATSTSSSEWTEAETESEDSLTELHENAMKQPMPLPCSDIKIDWEGLVMKDMPEEFKDLIRSFQKFGLFSFAVLYILIMLTTSSSVQFEYSPVVVIDTSNVSWFSQFTEKNGERFGFYTDKVLCWVLAINLKKSNFKTW
jgi:hypothetical protein